MFKTLRIWLYVRSPEWMLNLVPSLHPRRHEAARRIINDVRRDPSLESIRESMAREMKLDKRLDRRTDPHIPGGQELRARLLAAHTRPRD